MNSTMTDIFDFDENIHVEEARDIGDDSEKWLDTDGENIMLCAAHEEAKVVRSWKVSNYRSGVEVSTCYIVL